MASNMMTQMLQASGGGGKNKPPGKKVASASSPKKKPKAGDLVTTPKGYAMLKHKEGKKGGK